MAPVVGKIQELEMVTGLSKHERLVQGILNAIDERLLVTGDALPSVNQMVRELGFARKTIVKAYTELKDRGIVESKNRMGYFIRNESIHQRIKIMLLLYRFNILQEIFYKDFKQALGENVQVDTFFHHNNFNVFSSILSDNMGKYGMYIVAPIHHKEAREILRLLPPTKLLLVDRYENIGEEYSYITQKFEPAVYQALLELHETISQFNEFVFFYQHGSYNPEGTYLAFDRYVNFAGIKGIIEPYYRPGTLKKGNVYFPLADTDLLNILKDSLAQHLTLGKDFGILSYDDTPVKEIICGGITTIAADFREMAQKAANYVFNRQTVQETMTCRLIRRASL